MSHKIFAQALCLVSVLFSSPVFAAETCALATKHVKGIVVPDNTTLTEFFPGNGSKKLLSVDEEILSFDWNPKANDFILILGTNSESGAKRSILKYSAATGESTRIPSRPSISNIKFSPTGEYAFYFNRYNEGPHSLRLLDLASGKEIPFPNGHFIDREPFWTTDGAYLYASETDPYAEGLSLGPSKYVKLSLPTGKVIETIDLPENTESEDYHVPGIGAILLKSTSTSSICRFPQIDKCLQISKNLLTQSMGWYPPKGLFIYPEYGKKGKAYFKIYDIHNSTISTAGTYESMDIVADWIPDGTGVLIHRCSNANTLMKLTTAGLESKLLDFAGPEDLRSMDGNRNIKIIWKDSSIGVAHFYNDWKSVAVIFDLKSGDSCKLDLPLKPQDSSAWDKDRFIRVLWK